MTHASSTSASCPRIAGYSTLQGPVTCMVRPHPSVWRFIHGVLVAYLLLLVFLLFQDVGNARQFLKVSAGVSPPFACLRRWPQQRPRPQQRRRQQRHTRQAGGTAWQPTQRTPCSGCFQSRGTTWTIGSEPRKGKPAHCAFSVTIDAPVEEELAALVPEVGVELDKRAHGSAVHSD